MGSEAGIRGWQSGDVAAITRLWLAAYEEVRLPDMPLRAGAPERLRTWLLGLVGDRRGFGYVAVVDGELAGFLVGRVADWSSEPPIVETRRMALIDAVTVAASHRRRGIGTALVEHAIREAAAKGVRRVETHFELDNEAAVRMWRRAGFSAWIARAYRTMSEESGAPNS